MQTSLIQVKEQKTEIFLIYYYLDSLTLNPSSYFQGRPPKNFTYLPCQVYMCWGNGLGFSQRMPHQNLSPIKILNIQNHTKSLPGWQVPFANIVFKIQFFLPLLPHTPPIHCWNPNRELYFTLTCSAFSYSTQADHLSQVHYPEQSILLTVVPNKGFAFNRRQFV